MVNHQLEQSIPRGRLSLSPAPVLGLRSAVSRSPDTADVAHKLHRSLTSCPSSSKLPVAF